MGGEESERKQWSKRGVRKEGMQRGQLGDTGA